MIQYTVFTIFDFINTHLCHLIIFLIVQLFNKCTITAFIRPDFYQKQTYNYGHNFEFKALLRGPTMATWQL